MDLFLRLAAGLPDAPALTRLYLSHNSIGDVGAHELCRVLTARFLLASPIPPPLPGDPPQAYHLDLNGNHYSAASELALTTAGGTQIEILHHYPDDSEASSEDDE